MPSVEWRLLLLLWILFLLRFDLAGEPAAFLGTGSDSMFRSRWLPPPTSRGLIRLRQKRLGGTLGGILNSTVYLS
jgi:hypothetical protein